jgi:hypothetical protein
MERLVVPMIAASELHLPAAAARQTSSRGACTCSPGLALEDVFLNVYGAQESIPRNEFRQPM